CLRYLLSGALVDGECRVILSAHSLASLLLCILKDANCKVHTLNLSWNQIGAEGAKWLAEALKVNTECCLKAKICIHFFTCLSLLLCILKDLNCKIQILYLRDNKIGAEGAKWLAEALKVNTACCCC